MILYLTYGRPRLLDEAAAILKVRQKVCIVSSLTAFTAFEGKRLRLKRRDPLVVDLKGLTDNKAQFLVALEKLRRLSGVCRAILLADSPGFAVDNAFCEAARASGASEILGAITAQMLLEALSDGSPPQGGERF
jgi:hypothetical protein